MANLSKLLGHKLLMRDMPMVFPMMPGMGYSIRGLGGSSFSIRGEEGGEDGV